jgi:hypothetical protein
MRIGRIKGILTRLFNMKTILIFFLIGLSGINIPEANADSLVKIAIIWEQGKPSGEIELSNGETSGSS